MKRNSFICTIFLYIPLISYSPAQNPLPGAAPVPSSPPPAKEGPPAPMVQGPVPPDFSQQAFVVEHFFQSARFENDGTGREEQEANIRVISESGVQALGQVKLGYNALSDKLEIAYVRVRKPDGTTVAAQESVIQDLTIPDAPVYTDYHQKHISVPSLRPGDTLEYRYVRTIFNPLIPGQFWTSYNFNERGIVLDEQVEINIPKDREVKLKTRSGYEPKISDVDDRRIYRWKHSQLKEDESGFKRRRGAENDEPPAIELTTFKSWEELGDWYRWKLTGVSPPKQSKRKRTPSPLARLMTWRRSKRCMTTSRATFDTSASRWGWGVTSRTLPAR